MKYIDADKLIAEIERRKKQDVTFRERSLLIDMENAIASLQQEQPEVELEKEMDEYYDSPLWEGENVSWMTYTRIARHFYELGQQNRSKISNNSLKELRKEVIKFNQDHFDELHSDMDTIDIVHIVAIHFFELGKIARTEE